MSSVITSTTNSHIVDNNYLSAKPQSKVVDMRTTYSTTPATIYSPITDFQMKPKRGNTRKINPDFSIRKERRKDRGNAPLKSRGTADTYRVPEIQKPRSCEALPYSQRIKILTYQHSEPESLFSCRSLHYEPATPHRCNQHHHLL